MCVAVAGLAFDGDVLNGGVGVKIAFDRCQAAKIAERRQWEYKFDSTGKRTANKLISPLREAGDVWFVDANVTGSDEGDAKNPKFSMKSYFAQKVVPVLDKITGEGGQFEGYTVTLQGDNAPGHVQGGFAAWLREEFDRRGWFVQNQAPQSPYVNVCGLSIFPGMSKRHTHRLLKDHGYKVPSPDEIWEAALEIWKELSSCTIARAFMQARRVHDIIIKDGGKESWLSKGGPHCNTRKDFKNGADGVSVWPVGGREHHVDDWLPFREKKGKRMCKLK